MTSAIRASESSRLLESSGKTTDLFAASALLVLERLGDRHGCSWRELATASLGVIGLAYFLYFAFAPVYIAPAFG